MQSVALARDTTLYRLDECLERFASMGYIPPIGMHMLTAIDNSPSPDGSPPLRIKETDVLNSQIVLAGLALLKEQMVGREGGGLTGLKDIDLTECSLLSCIQAARPPCRWEEIYIVAATDISCSDAAMWALEGASAGAAAVSAESQGQRYRLKVVLDIAHNPPAIKSLMDKVAYRCKDINVRHVFFAVLVT
jgi:hypothetical protein